MQVLVRCIPIDVYDQFFLPDVLQEMRLRIQVGTSGEVDLSSFGKSQAGAKTGLRRIQGFFPLVSGRVAEASRARASFLHVWTQNRLFSRICLRDTTQIQHFAKFIIPTNILIFSNVKRGNC